MVQPTSRWFHNQGLKLHYSDWGNPDAPPLVLVHGMADHGRSWDRVAPVLAERFHVMALDLRGHGDSDWAPGGGYSVLQHASDLAALVQQQSLAPLTIVAHSLGGSVSLAFAGTYPEKVKQLVAIEGLGPSPRIIAQMAAIPPQDHIRTWMEQATAAAARGPRPYPDLEAAAARLVERNERLDIDWARTLARLGTREQPDGGRTFKLDPLARVFNGLTLNPEHVHALWARVSCPVLLLLGTESDASDPAKDGRMGHFQDARLVHVEGAGHFAHHDRLQETLDAITAFLQ